VLVATPHENRHKKGEMFLLGCLLLRNYCVSSVYPTSLAVPTMANVSRPHGFVTNKLSPWEKEGVSEDTRL